MNGIKNKKDLFPPLYKHIEINLLLRMGNLLGKFALMNYYMRLFRILELKVMKKKVQSQTKAVSVTVIIIGNRL